MLCDDLKGWEGGPVRDICICLHIADSLPCIAENNALYVKQLYPNLKNGNILKNCGVQSQPG